ncbi:MAG: phosphoglycerate kinase [Patescibacteria group bacterium]|nr:phosphoglycerate kinase [Patescibacteria group bacterium]
MKLKNLRKNYRQVVDKTVFLRVDFNVVLSSGKLKEDFKIRQSLETINFLLKNKCRLVLASHLGQPKNGFESKYSLALVAKYLEKILDKKVIFFDYREFSKFSEIRKKILSGGDIFLLDNLRFYNGEERNCKRLAKSLASLADVYVNDAFAVSHRANSSISAIRSNMPSFMGLLLEKEILNLNKILHPKRPSVVVMGGAKISTKIPIIKKLYSKASYILLGGALINDFYLAQGFNIGKSLVDKDGIKLVKRFLNSKKIILPVDVVVRDESSLAKPIISIKKIAEISDNDRILDIGPETILLFSQYIKKAQTIVWNGPLGMFEDEKFKKGTVIIAREIASRASGRAFGVCGGGETVEALNSSGMSQYMDFVSTGGGAMLSYLAGEKMPGIN